jgi:hypothetical protein
MMPWVDKDIRIIYHMKLKENSSGFIGLKTLRPVNGRANETIVV